MMLFVRAEREGDWPLHMWCVAQMLPCFFAAGHINYARYGTYYLRSMEILPKEVLDEFLRGQHVMRHKPGIWNGVWSDMFIESIFMHYGHGPEGIIGITLQPCTLNRWALSLHICSQLTQDVIAMNEESPCDVLSHKEELSHRIQTDKMDREHIRQRLNKVINPLEPEQHQSSPALVNIVTGQVAPDEINVDRAVSIGQKQLEEFERRLPEGFRASISKKVITMKTMRKHITVGSIPVYDTNLIYSRVIGLQGSRDISMDNILQYDLSPVPTPCFMRMGQYVYLQTSPP